MATQNHIRNPFEMVVEQVSDAVAAAGRSVPVQPRPRTALPAPSVRRISARDLREVLEKGLGDLGAYRSDVLFVCLIYPLAGLFLAQAFYGRGLLPLIFPLASGFALIGPAAAVGLYEISRRREQGMDVSWGDAFGVIRSPAFGSILILGLVLVGVFVLWMLAAWGIYAATLGPQPPASTGAFLRDVFLTPQGWTMIAVGMGVGFLFAVMAFTLSVVSFPLLLDRNVGVGQAIATSVRAVLANPAPMALWGVIVAAALVVGSLPALIGLILVMPVLGHATWHLYRKAVAPA